jgi:hypothetical protein
LAAISKLSTGIRPIDMPGDYEQEESHLAEALAAGDAVRFDANGDFTGANGTTTTESNFVGILLTGGVAGEPATAICKGKVAGFDLSALAYGDPVYLSDTDKTLETTTAATVDVIIGRVYPGRASGATKDKILKVGA